MVGISDSRKYGLRPTVIVPCLTWDKIRPQATTGGGGELLCNLVAVQLDDPTQVEAMRQFLTTKVDDVEIVDLKTAYEKYHDQGFEIVGVSLDGPDREEFDAQCEEKEVVWPQIWDGQGWDAELARKFYISGVPTPVLLDRDNRVVAVGGDARGEDLVEKVGELIDR